MKFNLQHFAVGESLEEAIDRIRKRKKVESELARESEIERGTQTLQTGLTDTQTELARQEAEIDPALNQAKASATAGTRVASRRLQNVLPFIGQQSGRSARQLTGLETDLQSRKGILDTEAAQARENINLARQDATRQFNVGIQNLTAEANERALGRDISADETADTQLLNLQAQREQEEMANFANTIGRFAQDYTAKINEFAGDDDPTNDKFIPLLEAARQEKIETQNLDPLTGQPLAVDTTPTLSATAALDLWEQTGVANEAIARALGINVGERFRPPTRSIGNTGLTDSQLSTNARYKITNGIPLTAEEGRVLGLEAGYIDPNFNATGTNTFLEDADTVLNPITIDTISDSKKQVLENLINNPQLHNNDPNVLIAILDDQGIKLKELEVYEEWRDAALANQAFQ